MSKNGPKSNGFEAGPEAARRFAELVELRMRDRDCLSRAAEAALVEDGVRTYGLPLAQARGIVVNAAEEFHVALARDLEKGVEQWVRTAGGKSKRLSRQKFNEMVAAYESGAHGELSSDEIKKRVKALMEKNAVEPKRAGLLRSRRWYRAI